MDSSAKWFWELVYTVSFVIILCISTVDSAKTRNDKIGVRNIGGGLVELLEYYYEYGHASEESKATLTIQERNGQEEVLVEVFLNGQVGLDKVVAMVEKTGSTVVAKFAGFRFGVLSAYVPLNKIETVAQIVGVQSEMGVTRPVHGS
mmetsp:Transcript_7793/g.12470  ORF Transcript_7793/g.12470 Transcript_7793/m.12470 type:complete len:147 (+) Transcript_7793:41-481(+)